MWRGYERNISNLHYIKSSSHSSNKLQQDSTANSTHSALSTSSCEKIMKVAFTGYHNSQTFGVDSVNPYLGENSSMHNGKLFTMYGPIERTPKGDIRLSCSVPIEQLARRNKEKTFLTPVEGTESWTKGNRYLIVPALLVHCPSSALKYFWNTNDPLASLDLPPSKLNSLRKFGDATETSCFRRRLLGSAVGVQLSPSSMMNDDYDWFYRKFILCQNFLLEYGVNDDIHGQPCGYIHLQSTLISAHPIFVNALEIEFDKAPYSLGPKRKVC